MKEAFFKGNRSSNYVSIKLNTDKLENIKGALEEHFITRVGILGSKASRMNTVTTKSGKHRAGKDMATMTNAEIGLVHEKGSTTRHIPRRSFLEMPLILKSEKLLSIRNKIWEIFNYAGEESAARLKQAYASLGIAAENIVQSAFASGGFGRWAADKEATIRRKGSSAPLIDTAQLRRSITSDVVSK
jgi:hypothetical protein